MPTVDEWVGWLEELTGVALSEVAFHSMKAVPEEEMAPSASESMDGDLDDLRRQLSSGRCSAAVAALRRCEQGDDLSKLVPTLLQVAVRGGDPVLARVSIKAVAAWASTDDRRSLALDEVHTLSSVLDAQDSILRYQAVRALWWARPREAGPRLIAALSDADRDVRSLAAGALERIIEAGGVVEPLAEIEASLVRDEGDLRPVVDLFGTWLGSLPTDRVVGSSSLLASLDRLLTHDDRAVRVSAARALSRWAEHGLQSDAEHVSSWAQRLTSVPTDAAIYLCLALGEIARSGVDSPVRQALRATRGELEKLIHRGDDRVAEAARWTQAMIDSS